jgi:hypothetical protein
MAAKVPLQIETAANNGLLEPFAIHLLGLDGLGHEVHLARARAVASRPNAWEAFAGGEGQACN